MINITVGNNMKRQTVAVDSETTVQQVLETAGIDYSRGMTTLNGAPLQPGDFYKTFGALGVTENAYLLSVVKADNAF